MKTPRLPLLLAIVTLVTPAAAGIEFVLVDGRVLKGEDFDREGDVDILEQEDGTSISLPVELVQRVVVTKDEPSEETPEAPTGIREERPRNLAGMMVKSRSPAEKFEVFGEPRRFAASFPARRWEPNTDWGRDSATKNNFAPSRWPASYADPTWEPVSAFDADRDVLAGRRSTWKRSPTSPYWTPTDGFAR